MFHCLVFLTILVAKPVVTAQLSNDLEDILTMTANVTNKAATWNATVPACSWLGVLCDPTTGAVTQCRWRAFHIGGVIDFTSMPANLYFIDVSYNQLTGTPDLAVLPAALRRMHLSNNRFSGIVDLTRVWGGMTLLTLANNNFLGNGTFETPAAWCTPSQKKMCLARDGTFDCTRGTWKC